MSAAVARAQVYQTDSAMTPLPQPVGMLEKDLVTQSWGWSASTVSYTNPSTGVNLGGGTIRFGDFYSPNGGYPAGSMAYPQFVDGDAISLSGLFKWRGELLDPVKDARTAPGAFNPGCGFSVEYMLRGGNCPMDIGWYNVTNANTPPAPSEIYVLASGAFSAINCLDEGGAPKTDGFCPKSWDNRSPRNLSIQVWQKTTFSTGSIKTDPHYTGGDIGLVLLGNPSSACTANKFSVYDYNQKNTSGVPWVTMLIYRSTVDPTGFYFAAEGLPMSAADWRTPGGVSNATNDGSFVEQVFYASGLSCAGGNQACSTGLQGACAPGVTECSTGGVAAACRPIKQPAAELCDGIDNDCDGVVDDDPQGGKLCPDPSKPICFHGQCVGDCSKGDFACPGGQDCDAKTGKCMATGCSAVTCPAGQTCNGGVCADPCTSVTCPSGQVCELGSCVDPCAGVICPGGRVCESGLCLPDCSCRGCPSGLSCGSDGRCADAACQGIVCPAGQTCVSGSCIVMGSGGSAGSGPFGGAGGVSGAAGTAGTATGGSLGVSGFGTSGSSGASGSTSGAAGSMNGGAGSSGNAGSAGSSGSTSGMGGSAGNSMSGAGGMGGSAPSGEPNGGAATAGGGGSSGSTSGMGGNAGIVNNTTVIVEKKGCGCRVGSESSERNSAWLLAVGGALLARKRRRRAVR